VATMVVATSVPTPGTESSRLERAGVARTASAAGAHQPDKDRCSVCAQAPKRRTICELIAERRTVLLVSSNSSAVRVFNTGRSAAALPRFTVSSRPHSPEFRCIAFHRFTVDGSIKQASRLV
jgi:hypothetical protein